MARNTRKSPYVKRKAVKTKGKASCVGHGRVEAPYPHFRYYKKSKHPALIVGEQKCERTEEYKYRKVMHSEKDGERTNERVYPNPNPKDPTPMYIGKRIRHDDKGNFEERPLPWKYPKK